MDAFKLKNGSQVIIRQAEKEDARELIDFYNVVGGETDFLSFGKDEFMADLDAEVKYIENIKNEDNSNFIIATINEKIIGAASITSIQKRKMKHVGTLGIVIKEEYCGLGIGGILIDNLVNWSKQNGITKKISLLTRCDNYNAIELYKKNIIPRDIITSDAITNALLLDMAIGGSSNTLLHLASIANEAGVEFDMDMVEEIAARTPHIVKLKPAGLHFPADLDNAGGVAAVMKDLMEMGLLKDTMTVTANTTFENIKGARVIKRDVIRTKENAYSQTGGLAILYGTLAPEGAVCKKAGVVPEMMKHKGPARVFNKEEEAVKAIFGGEIKPGDVVVVRYEGPKAAVDI